MPKRRNLWCLGMGSKVKAVVTVESDLHSSGFSGDLGTASVHNFHHCMFVMT